MTTLITNGLIKLAQQAGFNLEFDDYVYEHWNSFQAFTKLVAEAAASKEREACAMQLDASANKIRSRLGGLTDEDHLCIGVLVYEAKQIRARGEPTSRGEA